MATKKLAITERDRQEHFIGKFRKKNYNLQEAIKAAKISEKAVRRWLVHDPDFRDLFNALADEQMIFIKQAAREMATGIHESCGGKPDKQMMRWVLNDHEKSVGRDDGLKPEERMLLAELGDLEDDEIDEFDN